MQAGMPPSRSVTAGRKVCSERCGWSCGMACCGMAWHGTACHGIAWLELVDDGVGPLGGGARKDDDVQSKKG